MSWETLQPTWGPALRAPCFPDRWWKAVFITHRDGGRHNLGVPPAGIKTMRQGPGKWDSPWGGGYGDLSAEQYKWFLITLQELNKGLGTSVTATAVQESPSRKGFKSHVDVAPGDMGQCGLGSAGETVGLCDPGGLLQHEGFCDCMSWPLNFMSFYTSMGSVDLPVQLQAVMNAPPPLWQDIRHPQSDPKPATLKGKPAPSSSFEPVPCTKAQPQPYNPKAS